MVKLLEHVTNCGDGVLGDLGQGGSEATPRRDHPPRRSPSPTVSLHLSSSVLSASPRLIRSQVAGERSAEHHRLHEAPFRAGPSTLTPRRLRSVSPSVTQWKRPSTSSPRQDDDLTRAAEHRPPVLHPHTGVVQHTQKVQQLREQREAVTLAGRDARRKDQSEKIRLRMKEERKRRVTQPQPAIVESILKRTPAEFLQ